MLRYAKVLGIPWPAYRGDVVCTEVLPALCGCPTQSSVGKCTYLKIPGEGVELAGEPDLARSLEASADEDLFCELQDSALFDTSDLTPQAETSLVQPALLGRKHLSREEVAAVFALRTQDLTLLKGQCLQVALEDDIQDLFLVKSARKLAINNEKGRRSEDVPASRRNAGKGIGNDRGILSPPWLFFPVSLTHAAHLAKHQPGAISIFVRGCALIPSP